MKILCHVGPWCKDQFAAIARGIDPSATLVFVSGFREVDESGLPAAYYEHVDGKDDLAAWADIRDDEVIKRCRLLRSFDSATAHRHVRAMRRAVRDMLAVMKPDLFLCESIDQFLHDILFQEANAAGVATYGMIRSFVNGYYRVSERGEMCIVRQPPADEVEHIREKLAGDRYIPGNLILLKKRPLVTYLRIMLSNLARVAYFAIKRQLSGQKYNYHYWTSERTTRQVYAHVIPKTSLGTPGWREEIAASGKPVIYIPLQHFPEATVDYWTENPHFIDYPRRLLELVHIFRQDFQILLKEHPGVWGYRKPSFYSQFENLPGVTICPTNEPSQDCISACDAVLVWTGSVGFEAALRGKAVLTVCHPYYMQGERFFHIDLATPPAAINAFIQRCRELNVTRAEQNALVTHLLSGLIEGRFQNDGSFDRAVPADVEDARKIGVMLRSLYVARA